jgi:tetratricopeptide (TPR) repeat protein
MLRTLPELARLLLMTDEQKFAYEQQQARQAPVEAVVLAPLPPPPELELPAGKPPPPVVVSTPCPPPCGEVRIEDFDRLPLPGQAPPTAALVLESEQRVKGRLLRVALQLGDNLFRRGRYREAQTHFAFALNLSPGQRELSLRIERCRKVLPPPPPVVAVAVPSPPPRPRIAVLNFVVNADPSVAPPGFGDWAAQYMACQFSPTYEVVDRGELFWYMGRLGLSVRDVLTDAAARRWLGRALNVRFFVFGVVQQTASFDVSTHLVDAESGVKQGTGHIHVKDHQELKLRMNELAGQAVQTPADRDRLQREAQENERLLNQARQLCKGGKPAEAAALCREALQKRPEDVALRVQLAQAEQQIQRAALEEARQREFKERQKQALTAQRLQEKLAREAQAARIRAQQAASGQTEAARRAQELQTQRAHDQLFAQGQRALAQGNYPQAIPLLESALALKPSEAAKAALAQARVKAAETARAQAVREQARRQEAQRRQHAAEVPQSRAKLAEESRRRAAEEAARQKRVDDFQGLVKRGREALAAKRYDEAVKACTEAKALLPDDRTAQDLLRQVEKARADARLAADLAARKKLEEQRAERVRQLLAAGRAALAAKRHNDAIQAFTEAGRLAPNDTTAAALLQQAVNQRHDAQAAAAAAAKRQEEERRRGNFNRWMVEGQAAMTGKRYAAAVKAYGEALKLQPADAGAAMALHAAQQALAVPKPPPKPPTIDVQAEYAKQMQTGAAFEKQQKFTEAARAYKMALQWRPRDAKAAAALKVAEFGLHMAEGQKAMAAKRFADAAREFEAALKLFPNHPAAAAALKQARQGR